MNKKIKEEYFAHSIRDKPISDWQPLHTHLKKVGELSSNFASQFGGESLAYLAGLWHDLGKYQKEFQSMLKDQTINKNKGPIKKPRIIHSSMGGWLAIWKKWKGYDRILSWLIMGHHTGLADYSSSDSGGASLEVRMRNSEKVKSIISDIPDWILNQAPPNIKIVGDPAFFIRMLFSTLVDSDFLDTEEFMAVDRARARKIRYPTMELLYENFNHYMNELCCNAPKTKINSIRKNILEQCRIASGKKPSVFTLTVPTGGGKTLCSMAFALRHALKYGKRRIIYVIPYTSIIEQTAEVFRNIPGFQDSVVEHHHNVVDKTPENEYSWHKLAIENWDASIIVTTNVQFFESLYANKPGKCRKLHNISNSIIIFDEVQCFPSKYLKPIVFGINELFKNYKVTPVLCSATLPVLTARKEFDFDFREGFNNDDVIEIVDKPENLADELKRIQIQVHNKWTVGVAWDELADDIISEKASVLCIVNRKEDCRNLYKLVSKLKTAYHLSTNMCAEHRFNALRLIKDKLKKSNIVVISTSLIEAGVDIDFPIVYRELAGIDSIAQAAGRCNREGILGYPGKTVVFQSNKKTPSFIKQDAEITRELINQSSDLNILSVIAHKKYFKQKYWQLGSDRLDEKDILGCFKPYSSFEFSFKTAAHKFCWIDEQGQFPLIVPYGNAFQLVNELIDNPWISRKIMRKLQRFIVMLFEAQFFSLINKGHIREIDGFPGLFQLLTEELYDSSVGLVSLDNYDKTDPEKYFV
jgi:CRISPR-associated endonuclease/helicase Cas3